MMPDVRAERVKEIEAEHNSRMLHIGVYQANRELYAALERAEAQLAASQQEIEGLRKDVVYHAECRPNRRQAEAAMADAKAMNDKWADEVAAHRETKAQLAASEAQLHEERETSAALLEQNKDLIREAVLVAASEAGSPQICSQQVVSWLRAYASTFLVHNLIHGDIERVADHLAGMAAPPADASPQQTEDL
jgi:hypothetical protein